MDYIIRKDILRIITKVNAGLKRGDAVFLSKTSNEINHNSSIFQDEDSIKLAVVVYALSKVIDRSKGKVETYFKDCFRKAKQFLKVDDYIAYRKEISKVVKRISELDKGMREYILHIYNQAEIKKGSKLLSNGISLARVSELMGISQWELMNYAGKTNISDTFGSDRKMNNRLKYARGLFGL